MVTSVSTPAANPFNMNPTSGQATSGSTSSSFEQQLSTALAESLEKLGVAPGEVNITIRNNGSQSGSQAAARQIVISFNSLSSGINPPAGNTESATTTATVAMDPAEAATAPSAAQEPSFNTAWAPYAGPRDARDQMNTGGGNLTASGAPLIRLSDRPATNQYNYAGAAARNPYFTTPSNPLREGYVAGFDNWFMEAFITGGKSGPVPAAKNLFTTEDGAAEALRLVQQHYPDAEIVQKTWGGGPFNASSPSNYIQYGGGRIVNAGGILYSYYNQGYGVTTASDGDLQRTLELT